MTRPHPAAAPAGPAPVPQPAGVLPDVRAGVVTAALVVLLGAPAGLLWAALAPRVEVSVGDGRFDRSTSAFIAADAVFLAVVVVLGAATGAVAWLVARRYGPGVVVGLLVGGLLAAWVASLTGQEVGRDTFVALVEAGAAAQGLPAPGPVTGTVEASVRLRTPSALALWPAAALGAFALLTAVREQPQPLERLP